MKNIILSSFFIFISGSIIAQRHYHHARIRVRISGSDVEQGKVEQKFQRPTLMEEVKVTEPIRPITSLVPAETLENYKRNEPMTITQPLMLKTYHQTNYERNEEGPVKQRYSHVFKRNHQLKHVQSVRKTNMVAWGVLALVSAALMLAGAIIITVGWYVVVTLAMAFVFSLLSLILLGLGILGIVIALIIGGIQLRKK